MLFQFAEVSANHNILWYSIFKRLKFFRSGGVIVPTNSAYEEVQQERLRASGRVMVHSGLVWARALASAVNPEDRLRFARAVVFHAVSAYWEAKQPASGWCARLRRLPAEISVAQVSSEATALARATGTAAAALHVAEASYRIGVIYTAMMPARFRSERGAYYTPPALCERLLDMATAAGVDWHSARVLDPACSGGAFLSPVARRMMESLKDCNAANALKNIQSRLRGFELDSFAAWISQVFLDVTLGKLCRRAGTRLRSVVKVYDSLKRSPTGDGFDLVVGNPPYGRVKLSSELREKFQRSLFGHANLYGLFTDLAMRFARPAGVIAYVTPTSFLAGEYFKALRCLLGREAPPASIAFIGDREGVFADVLQETMLAAYQCGGSPGKEEVHIISPGPDGSISTSKAGSFGLPDDPQQPWLMPRTEKQSVRALQASGLPYRLADYGYTVSTGPLVWNRHRASLRQDPGNGRYPLVWAESVRSDGAFEFRAERRNHKPFFEPAPKESWVLTDFPCVLLQRTTAKEQCRRLIAAELPASFIKQHGAVVVENHLNMIKPRNAVPRVSPAALSALLNSKVVDQVFRCINGSVAVSAYELESLPLPSPEGIKVVERLVKRHVKRETLERAVEQLYRGEAI